MASRQYTHFEGGVNKRLGPVVLDMGQDEAFFYNEDSTNWWCSDQGLQKYVGNLAVLTNALSGNPVITGIFEYKSPVSNLLELVVCAGTKVYTVSAGTATQIFTGVTTGKFFQATKWVDSSGVENLILMNGTDTPLHYDGTTCATITFTDPQTIWNSAKPKGAAVFRGRIFYWGDATHPYRIYTPRPGTFNNFDDNQNSVDSFDVDAGFGGVITGARALTDDLLVIYKERCIRSLQGSAPFNSGGDQFYLHVVTDSWGCIAPRTLVGNDIEHYFLAVDGLRQIKTSQNYGDVDPYQPTYLIQDIINTFNYSVGVIDNACAIYDPVNKQVWYSVPVGSNSTNNGVYLYSVVTKANDYRGLGDITAACLGFFNRVIYSGDYAGQLFKYTGNSYNTGVILSSWESKWVANEGLGAYKRYRDLFLYSDADNGGDIIVSYSVLRAGQEQAQSSTQSIAGGSSVWDSAVWDSTVWAAGAQGVFQIKNLGRGSAFKLRLANTSATQNPKIRMIDLNYEVFGRVRG